MKLDKGILYKFLSWRLISIAIGFIVNYLVVHSFNDALNITIWYTVATLPVFYFHEVAWKQHDKEST